MLLCRLKLKIELPLISVAEAVFEAIKLKVVISQRKHTKLNWLKRCRDKGKITLRFQWNFGN